VPDPAEEITQEPRKVEPVGEPVHVPRQALLCVALRSTTRTLSSKEEENPQSWLGPLWRMGKRKSSRRICGMY
jgi:hypothetical protein